MIGKGGDVRLALAQYDRSQTLTIDPTFAFSTYIGGPGYDNFGDVKVDSSGYVYLAGSSQTPASPTLNPFQQTNTVGLEPFVLKFSGDGQHVIYYAVVGDLNGWDGASGIAVDPTGSPTIVGFTNSPAFPLKNAFQTQFKAEYYTGFVTKLTADGRSLVFSTYFGGSQQDNPTAAALDSAGNIWLVGWTTSRDFPLKNALQTTLGSIVAKFSPTGDLLYSTYWGGTGITSAFDLTLDSNDNVYVAGFASAQDFPLRNALPALPSPTIFGSPVLFALSPDGQNVLFSTYLVNMGEGASEGVAIDGAGNIYVAGEVDDALLQATPGAIQPKSGGGADIFLMELNPTASKILYATYFGGSGDDGASDVKVDADGYIYITGYTQSPDFPVKSPLQTFKGGGATNRDLFVAKMAPGGSALVYSTPWGGSLNEYVGRVAVAGNGGVYVCGSTQSTDFPVQNAFQPNYGGGFSDGVFALIADSTPIAPSPLTASPGVLSFDYVEGGTTPPAQAVTITGGVFVASTSTSWLGSTAQNWIGRCRCKSSQPGSRQLQRNADTYAFFRHTRHGCRHADSLRARSGADLAQSVLYHSRLERHHHHADRLRLHHQHFRSTRRAGLEHHSGAIRQ